MINRAYTIVFKWDTAVWTVTLLFIAAFVIVCGVLFVDLLGGYDIYTLVELIIVAIIGFAILSVSEGYAPQCLEIGENELVILRRYSNITISREDIISVEPVSRRNIFGAVCVHGSCGLFGFYGTYSLKSKGSIALYATQFKDLFKITTPECTYIINCSEPDRLLNYYSDNSK